MTCPACPHRHDGGTHDHKAREAGELLSIIASDLFFAIHTLNEAIGQDETNHVVAAIALIEKAGALADTAAAALGAGRMADAEDWHQSPSARQALRTLKGGDK